MAAETQDINTKPETLVTKLLTILCCQRRCCDDCCECCLKKRGVKIKKTDIQYTFRQPSSRLDSNNSESSCDSGVVCSPSYRDRVSSDRSWRTSSTSSQNGPENGTGNRRSNMSPKIVDMKPIEFWAANKETVQPRTPKRRLPSESEISIDDFKMDLYNIEDNDVFMTDEQKLAKYKLGQIHLSFQYEIPNNTLIVKMMEARDLRRPYSKDNMRQDLAHSNPYAKVCLLHDQKASKQTAVQKKTQNPKWGEVFSFEIPFKEVQRRTLQVTVKDFDKYSRHCTIGSVHLPLDHVNLIKGGHVWKPLLPDTEEKTDLGEILLSLNFLPSAGRLNVDVIKAKQLLQVDMTGGSDPFVKVTLCQNEKPIKSKKTSVKKGTIEPIFNESFSFNLAVEQLESVSVVITLWHHNAKARDELMGRVVLGKYPTGPHQTTHWNRMLQTHRSAVAQWHTLRPREECDKISFVSKFVS